MIAKPSIRHLDTFILFCFLAVTPVRAEVIGECTYGVWSDPVFILRQDFNDIPGLGCTSLEDESSRTAIGSRLSFTSDRLADTVSLSADGLTALDFRYDPTGTSFSDLVAAVAVGPYVQGSGNLQFAKGNRSAALSDTLTSGGFAEVFLNPEPFRGFLRVHGGELTSNLGLRDPNVVIEYLPHFRVEGTSILIGGAKNVVDGFSYAIVPELEMQQDHYAGGPKSFKIFSTSFYSTRLGPVLSARVFDIDNLQNMVLALTYHFSVDVVSGRTYNIVQPVISYNFSSHFAVSGSYAYGNSEASGNLTSQFRLSLAAKY